MSVNWLHAFLVDAVQRRLCTKVYCTTCGAREFRRGALEALGQFKGRPAPSGFDREAASEIAKALARVTPVNDEALALAPAARCLLFSLWTGMPIFDSGIESTLSGTWAGAVLAGMQAHHAAREGASRAHDEFQKGAKGRRDEKERAKQQQHQARLALKKERDRLWREKSGKPEAS